MKCVPVHHGIPAVLHRDVLWLHLHSENGALVPVQPRKTRPYITENLLMGRNESNQTSTSCAYLRLKLTATFLLLLNDIAEWSDMTVDIISRSISMKV